MSLIPGSGRSPGEGNGNPLQYSCLENPMDRGAWWATVHSAKAGPALTEPMMKLEVVTPEESMGDVIGDLNRRRGQVEGMESARSGARIVKATVPLAEMFGYVTALRTITSGRATSSMTYDHHAQVSSSIAKAVLEEVKGRVDLV